MLGTDFTSVTAEVPSLRFTSSPRPTFIHGERVYQLLPRPAGTRVQLRPSRHRRRAAPRPGAAAGLEVLNSRMTSIPAPRSDVPRCTCWLSFQALPHCTHIHRRV